MLKHDRSTSFAKANFRIGTEHLILFGRQVFTDIFWFSKLIALLNYLCVSSISLAVQRRTPLEIRQYQQGAATRAEAIKSQGNSWSPR